MRTAGAPIPTGASSRTSEAIGAWLPRVRRWSPYTSNSAERACMESSLPQRCDNPATVGAGADGTRGCDGG